MVRDIDVSLLRAFVTVVETGKVTEAATVLHRTQAAVSMALRRLEEEIGRRLLERSARGVKLTAAGSVLLPYARQMLGIGMAARAALDAGQISGTVRLGILEDIAVGHLPHALRQFAASFPNVALEIVVESSQTLFHRLANGGLDFAIGDPTLINGAPIMTWQHPLHWTAGLSYRGELHGDILPIVAFGGACPWQEHIFAKLRQAGVAWRVICTSTSLPAIQSAVEAGLGVAALLRWNIRRDTMRVLDPLSEGLPPLPQADFGLFSHADDSEHSGAAHTLQQFLFYELQFGLSSAAAGS